MDLHHLELTVHFGKNSEILAKNQLPELHMQPLTKNIPIILYSYHFISFYKPFSSY